MRIQRLTLRLTPKVSPQPPSATTDASANNGQVVPLPAIQQKKSKRGSNLRRPSVMAMQMGLLSGPQAGPEPISQVKQLHKLCHNMKIDAALMNIPHPDTYNVALYVCPWQVQVTLPAALSLKGQQKEDANKVP
jgi:hypothetical protein